MTHIDFAWRGLDAARRASTGVSLHGHTLHSREPLGFLECVRQHFRPADMLLRHIERQLERRSGAVGDLNQLFWTPPLGPATARQIEARQIEEVLDLPALVSLTDHDSIDGSLSLAESPVSVEWTVPFRGTFFHLGMHNLPPARAAAWMSDFGAFTAFPVEAHLGDLLAGVAGESAALVVFNHPLWDEGRLGTARHGELATQFLSRYGDCIHALELNGLRLWQENARVLEWARAVGKPAVAGGDRHGFDPNPLINLSEASTFPEFVAEIRRGRSHVLVFDSYRIPRWVRIARTVWDAIRDVPAHSLGWSRWSDRTFYLGQDGEPTALSRLWDEGVRYDERHAADTAS